MQSHRNNIWGKRHKRRIPTRAFCAAVALLTCCATALGATPTASGQAYDFNIQISVASVSVLNIGPVDQVQFSDLASAYENAQNVLSFDSGGGLGVLARLQTGALDAETQWLPGPGFLAVGSRASANNVDLGVVNAIGGSLLSLKAPLIRSTAIITGTCPTAPVVRPANVVHIVDDYIFRNGFEIPNLQASSTAIVQGSQPGQSIDLSITGVDVANIPSDPAANTTVATGVIGATLVVNEQTLTGDGISGLGVASNAFHLSLNIAGIITADVVISHAQASIACN